MSSQASKIEQQEEPSTPFLLNESGAYMNGEGETLWLKVGEAGHFILRGESADIDPHSVTVKELGEHSATIVIASDPITVQLEKGETRSFDVNKDGIDDIEIKLVDIADGQAGLLFKLISSEAKIPVNVSAQSSGPKINNKGLLLGLFGVIISMCTLVIVFRKRLISAVERIRRRHKLQKKKGNK